MIDFDVCFLSISAKNEPPLHLNLKYTWLICTPGRQLALIQAIVSSKQNIINISNVSTMVEDMLLITFVF